MKAARCIKIENCNGVNYYTLVFPNGDKIKYEETVIEDALFENKIDIINMDHGLILSHKKMRWYTLFYEDKSKISEESHKMYIKSKLLNMETLNSGKSSYKKLLITDESHTIENNIKVDTIIFVGNNPLELKKGMESAFITIKCNKIIVMNPCILGYISNIMSEVHNIYIYTNNIEVSCKIVDIHLIYEIYEELKWCYGADLVIIENMWHTFNIDFKKAGIDHEEVKRVVLKIMKTALKNDYIVDLLSTIHFGCLMHRALNCEYDCILDLIDYCNYKINKIDAVSKKFDPYRSIHNKLLELLTNLKEEA